jgi:hypothetical protein
VVSNFLYKIINIESTIDLFQMENYWKNRPQAPPTDLPTDIASGSAGSDYDRYRLTLLSAMECDEWEAELRRYLKDMPADVTPDTDIVEWWQVSPIYFYTCMFYLKSTLESLQYLPYPCTHRTGYPPYPSLIRTV